MYARACTDLELFVDELERRRLLPALVRHRWRSVGVLGRRAAAAVAAERRQRSGGGGRKGDTA